MRNNKKWGGRDRKFFAETVYDCVRWWRLDWYLLNRKEGRVHISFLGPSLWRRGLEKPEWEEFENQDFEQFSNRIKDLTSSAIKESYPDWLYKKLEAALPGAWHELAPYFNKTNSVVLRVNTSKVEVEQVIKSLKEENIDVERLSGTTSGLILKDRANVFQTKVFKKGWFEVQDGASQQVAPFLEVEPGQRVVDACAGAGGKTLHIADIMQNKGQIISLDIHQWKLDQLKLRARRNSFSNIERKLVESTKTFKRLKGTADRLLLDVPCSGLGVLRRNPDTKWKISQKSIDELKETQKNILDQYSPIVKKQGFMVYSTCSILPEENEEQVESFIHRNPKFKLIKQKTIYPVVDGYDGFFMALLQRIDE